MSLKSNRLAAEELRSLAHGAIGAGFTAVGGQLEHSARIVRIQNLTNAELIFSYNGLTDNEILPAGSFLVLDVTANKSLNDIYVLATGSTIYARQSAVPTSGAVYVSIYYGG